MLSVVPRAAWRWWAPVLLGLALCPAALAAEAEAGPSALRINGFGTVGLVDSDVPAGWGFRRDVSQPANGGGVRGDIDTRLGLQLNASLSDQVELVAQLLLKRRLPEMPTGDSLEWGFASYRPTPDWTIRVGRTNPDVFLLSDYRNVGFAYPWVRPEIAFYGALPIYSLDGADVTRQWQLGDALWKLKLMSGTSRVWTAGSTQLPNTLAKVRRLNGLVLSREAAGLTLRGTAVHVRINMDSGPGVAALASALDQLAQLPLPTVQADARDLKAQLALDVGSLRFVNLGAAYEGEHWLWSAELSQFDGSLQASHTVNGYVSLGRRFGAWTAYGMLAASRTRGTSAVAPQWREALTPVLGPEMAAQAQMLGDATAQSINTYRLAQRSLSLGLRWDLHPQAALKLQWDHYRVRDHGSRLFGNAHGQGGRVNVGSLVLDFVF